MRSLNPITPRGTICEAGRYSANLGDHVDNAAKILVVEDEVLVALDIEDALGAAGFATRLVHNGENALEAINSGEPLAAILTDIRIPGPSGWDVARHGRTLFPQIPVIYMSGDSEADWDANGVESSRMLLKPFVMSELLTTIEMLSNGSGPGSTAP
nr:response regulator [Devosia ureilytica]